jgi:hypothetical protein
MLFQSRSERCKWETHFHDAVVTADWAELLDVQRRIGAVLQRKAALARHAIAASVEGGALIVLRFIPVNSVTNGAVL